MPILQLTIDAKVDGNPVRGFPKNLLLSVDETQEFDYEEPGDSNDTTFSALPIGEVDSVQTLILEAVNAVGVRLEGGESSNTAIRFSAGGGLVAWGVTLTDSNCTVNVNSASVARVRGLAGGT